MTDCFPGFFKLNNTFPGLDNFRKEILKIGPTNFCEEILKIGPDHMKCLSENDDLKDILRNLMIANNVMYIRIGNVPVTLTDDTVITPQHIYDTFEQFLGITCKTYTVCKLNANDYIIVCKLTNEPAADIIKVVFEKINGCVFETSENKLQITMFEHGDVDAFVDTIHAITKPIILHTHSLKTTNPEVFVNINTCVDQWLSENGQPKLEEGEIMLFRNTNPVGMFDNFIDCFGYAGKFDSGVFAVFVKSGNSLNLVASFTVEETGLTGTKEEEVTTTDDSVDEDEYCDECNGECNGNHAESVVTTTDEAVDEDCGSESGGESGSESDCAHVESTDITDREPIIHPSFCKKYTPTLTLSHVITGVSLYCMGMITLLIVLN